MVDIVTLIFKNLFIFNWRIIAFNVVQVFAIYQHESAIGDICPLPPEFSSHLPPHPTPSRLSQNTRFELPVSHKFPLAIYFTYGNIHVSVLLSQFVLLSPSPIVKSDLYIYVSFAALRIGSSVPSF